MSSLIFTASALCSSKYQISEFAAYVFVYWIKHDLVVTAFG